MVAEFERADAAGATARNDVARCSRLTRIPRFGKTPNMEEICKKRRIFSLARLEMGWFFNRISSGPADGVIITGGSSPAFNNRRFRLPFSSYANEAEHG